MPRCVCLAAWLAALLLMPTASAQLELKNDSATVGGAVVLQLGFDLGETGAVVLSATPGQGPVLVRQLKVWVDSHPGLPGPDELTGAFKLWDNADLSGGLLSPGAPIYVSPPLALATGGFSTWDVGSEQIVLSGPFTVGVEIVSSGQPSGLTNPTLVTDGDGCQHDLNWAQLADDSWVNTCDVGFSGDLVIRAVVEPLAVGPGPFGPARLLTSGASGARSVSAADIDGDGDLDVLAASELDDSISWFENTDGFGSFGPAQVITASAISATDVQGVDVDGDGDVDVLTASAGDSTIAWHENLDGLGTFGARQLITTNAFLAFAVDAADLDGDAAPDVLSASWLDNKLAWYENTDGLGAFGPQTIISTAAANPVSVFASDLDGDGDADVLSASQLDGRIAWYENTDGLGSFGPQRTITTTAVLAWQVTAADIDGDGDADVLSASELDDRIAWYENTDGLGTFGAPNDITNTADGATSVHACDLDGDGDADVLSASGADATVAWYENLDGTGSFGPPQVLAADAAQAFSVWAADLDGDGDADALSASWADGKVAWYENLLQWSDLGQALAGTSGAPILAGSGALLAGAPTSLSLSSARPNAVAVLVIGLSALNAPFKGGVLVPQADVLVSPLPTGPAGLVVLSAAWPLLPSGFTVYFQHWISDPAGPQGFAASNALSGTVP
jgi:hypothetical protein